MLQATTELVRTPGIMAKIRSRAHRVAETTLPILLTGETGTGKGVFARYIHGLRGRERPFVTIDCTTLPDHLVESELFGHVRGAFTGAQDRKPGLMEMANGGTAFFDEIAELRLDLQAKLLGALQDGQIRPVGGTKPKRLDFRVIAATNRDLTAEVKAGRFREDLYYRLAVAQIRLPALRDRREDIPILAQHFARIFGADELSEGIIGQLCSYTWPGNVRQLQHCIQCMVQVRMCPMLGDPDAEGCEISSWSTIPRKPPAIAEQAREDSELDTPFAPMAERTRLAIIEALERTGGDYSQAARLLGIGRTTLYRSIRKYGVQITRHMAATA